MEGSNCHNATFDNFNVDPEGIPPGVFGVPWNKIQAKDGLGPLAKSFNMTGSNLKRRAVLVEEAKAAFVQQNKCNWNREQQQSASNVHKDNHIRTHERKRTEEEGSALGGDRSSICPTKPT